MNGNFNDAGPNAIHGTSFGATATADRLAAANNAMDFSNPTSTVNQYGTHPINSNLNFGIAQDFSISFLFYIKSPFVHTVGLYDNGINSNGYGMFFWNPSGNYVLQFNCRNGSVASTAIPLATWKHVVCVREGSQLRIYIDGTQVSTGAVGSGTPAYSYDARFGSMFFSGFSPPQYNGMHGALDEFRIYNRALSATEIANMSGSTLPVQLSSFTAVTAANTVTLNWQTVSENNLSHFEIESSTDGRVFTRAGRVNAKGHATSSNYYNFTDAGKKDLIYYRLKMLDYDNTFSYSNILAVRSQSGKRKLQLFPNPATEQVQLQLPVNEKTQALISIHDFTGKQLYQQSWFLQTGNNSISIPVNNLAKGMYSIRIQTKTETSTLTFNRQ